MPGYIAPPQAPPAKRSRLLWWLLPVAVAAGVFGGGGAVLLFAGGDSPTESASSGSADVAPLFADEPAEIAPTTPDLPEPITAAPADFKIGVTVLSKQCFGSAGCNITFQIKPEYVGTMPLPEDGRTITIVYRVLGGDSGEQINRFTITDGTAEYPSEELISTVSSGTKLRAEATQVF